MGARERGPSEVLPQGEKHAAETQHDDAVEVERFAASDMREL